MNKDENKTKSLNNILIDLNAFLFHNQPLKRTTFHKLLTNKNYLNHSYKYTKRHYFPIELYDSAEYLHSTYRFF